MKVILFLLAFTTFVRSEDISQDDNVYVLTDDNFD